MKMLAVKRTLGVVVACAALCAAQSANANLITNGGFEADPAGTSASGTDFVDVSTITDWRAFAVGGATAAFTVEAAAANSGLVGVQLSRDAGGADSALDRDAHRIAISTQPRVYKQLVDVRDGGAHGGATNFVLNTQFFSGGSFSGNIRAQGIDPQAGWETTGLTASSAAGEDQLALRYSVDQLQSAYLDNVDLVDATLGVNRMINGGFENSATRVLDYRFVSVAGGAGSVALDPDAASGSAAALLTRTDAAGDSVLDLDPFRIATLGGETLRVDFASKKVTGAADSRIRTSLAMFNSGGAHLGDLTPGLFDPSTSSYSTFSTEYTLLPGTAFVNLGFRVFNAAGAASTGSYLLDDISVVGVPEPTSILLMGFASLGLLSLRRRSA